MPLAWSWCRFEDLGVDGGVQAWLPELETPVAIGDQLLPPFEDHSMSIASEPKPVCGGAEPAAGPAAELA